MARKPEFEPLYDAFAKFLKRCILSDRSFLWPEEEAWNRENVGEVKRRLVDTPVSGSDLSFEKKLLEQMSGASPQHWKIICDTFYVYFLPSSYMKFKKKVRDITWAAQQGGLTVPPPDSEIWTAQQQGFTRTTLKYHYKYSQFWLILLFAYHIKTNPHPERTVREPEKLQKLLDDLLKGIPVKNDRAYGMRHAMLYLAFPDLYERIISTRHKEQIVEAFRGRISQPTSEDIDESIRLIRESLGPEFDLLERPFDFYSEGELRKQWGSGREKRVIRDNKEEYLTEIRTPDDDLEAVLSVMEQTRNVILYGPPGTGKTYIAGKAAEELVRPQIKGRVSESVLMQRAIEDLTFHELLALSLYRSGSKTGLSVPEIRRQPLIEARYRFSPVKNPGANIWGRLQQHTSPDSATVGVSNRQEPYLFDKDTESRWSLTASGREYVEQTLSGQLAQFDAGPGEEPTVDYFVKWTTFHQSYAYEDFVEGLRPVPSDDVSGGINYEVVPGVFKRICVRAAGDPESKYVLVIDEINRGNIAKILGELITLLEDDKRLGQPNELSITLPYSGDDTFGVPQNLYIIGTMNTADRSMALLDVALRRRFSFVELMPRPELLDEVKVESEGDVLLGDLLRGLNQGVRRYLDRDHQIGHSYLLKVKEAREDRRLEKLEFVWNNQIVPLLEEYFYSQRDRLGALLSPFLMEMEAETPSDEASEADVEIGRPTGDDLLAALAKLAEQVER